jgi:PIN domain nuclease of toxin-antitoxin system
LKVTRLNPRFLLDTHIVIRWLSDTKKLSREQHRVLDDTSRAGEYFGVSAFSLIEISLLYERQRLTAGLELLFRELDTNPALRIIPLTTEVAREVFDMGDALRDPADRIIVATARVHRLRLLTSDQRIIDSDLVPVVE